MKKKILSVILLVCLLLCSLTSCFALPASRGETVSKEEWIDAFDLSDVQNMKIEVEVNETENEDNFSLVGSVTYSDKVLKAKYTETAHGNSHEEEWEEECDPLDFSDIQEIGLDYIAGIISHAYDVFEFSEDTGAYEHAMAMEDGIVAYVSVWFGNGNITKLAYSLELENDYAKASADATYKFTY